MVEKKCTLQNHVRNALSAGIARFHSNLPVWISLTVVRFRMLFPLTKKGKGYILLENNNLKRFKESYHGKGHAG